MKIKKGNRNDNSILGNVRISSCTKFRNIFYLLIVIWLVYVVLIIATAVHVHKRLDPSSSASFNHSSSETNNHDMSPHHIINDNVAAEIKEQYEEDKKKVMERQNEKEKSLADLVDKIKDIKKEPFKPKGKIMRPGFKADPHGHMVKPEVWIAPKNNNANDSQQQEENQKQRSVPPDQVLTLYMEPVDQSTWRIKPYPMRTTTAKDLTKATFPKLNSCQKLPEQWPVDEFPDNDPYLPWIHDVFPTDDGKFIQFVAQNKGRCHTGFTEKEERIVNHMKPQVTLFQHVPLKKVDHERYRLSSHEDADPESVSTRFICKFKPSGDITFSKFNNDYEWASFRKGLRHLFSEDGRDIKHIHTSQLIFQCPVPDHLVEQVRTGASVDSNDWATLFVDLIPVRTPPRYGNPAQFLTPYYQKDLGNYSHPFRPDKVWGTNHVLPAIQDSGRWENIPICKPSLLAYDEPKVKVEEMETTTKKPHRLVSCLWASVGYATRGNRYAVNDGQRRLLEWITFNKMLGFDHFYIYDNSAAFTNETSLQPFADLFPDDVTIIKWPSRVCNNRPNNVDSPGERSSQYAAESSCRLRFGPRTEWFGHFDIDEYLIPMGDYDSLLPILDKLDKEGNKIISFASWRAWPRLTHINEPIPIKNKTLCGHDSECFELSVVKNTTMMEAYNCDRQKPGEKTKSMPAEKQLYRADYVTQHFIHYSTITESTNLRMSEYDAKFKHKRPFPDPLSRFGDEVNEALMLHSKAVARQDTAGWIPNCMEQYKHRGFDQCRIGIPWPEHVKEGETFDEKGWMYNCYVNTKIDRVFGPRLQAKLRERGFL